MDASKSCSRAVQSCPELLRVTQSYSEVLRVTRDLLGVTRRKMGYRRTDRPTHYGPEPGLSQPKPLHGGIMFGLSKKWFDKAHYASLIHGSAVLTK